MSRSRGSRVLRGLAAASISTFVALLSHIVSGGAMPSAVGIIVPWVVASLVCIALAGQMLSAFRLSASVIASQVLFHVLFVLGAGGSSSDAAPAHHGHTPRSLVFEPAGVEFADAGMWAAHVAAAVATIVLLHRGEVAIRGILRVCTDLARAARRRVRALTIAVRQSDPARGQVHFDVESSIRARSLFAAALGRRGPPPLHVL